MAQSPLGDFTKMIKSFYFFIIAIDIGSKKLNKCGQMPGWFIELRHFNLALTVAPHCKFNEQLLTVFSNYVAYLNKTLLKS